LLGASFLIFIANFIWSIFIDPKASPANPWDSRGLEWQTANPVPPHNFDRIPVVLDDPYHYSEPGAPAVADMGDGELVTVGASVPSGDEMSRAADPETGGPSA
jgi:cytochrome c oxidase subunit 1